MPKSSYADFVKSHYNKKLSFKQNTQAISRLWAKQKAGKGVVLENAAKDKTKRAIQKRRDKVASEGNLDQMEMRHNAAIFTAREAQRTTQQIKNLRRDLEDAVQALQQQNESVNLNVGAPAGADPAAAGPADAQVSPNIIGRLGQMVGLWRPKPGADAGAAAAAPAAPAQPKPTRGSADRDIARQGAKTPPPRRRQKGEGQRGLGKVIRNMAKLTNQEFQDLRNAMVAHAGMGRRRRGRGMCTCHKGGETSQEMAAARPPPERSEAQARMAAEKMAQWKRDHKDREDKAPKISDAMKELLKKPRKYCTMGMDAASRRCRGERVPGIDDF